MDLGRPLSITSWNVEGLCGTLWKRIISKWVSDQPLVPDILCLQEVKADGFRLDAALRMILPEHLAVILLPMLGNGGTAVLVHPSIKIEESGQFRRGQVAWVIVTWQDKRFGVMSIYAPNSARKKKSL